MAKTISQGQPNFEDISRIILREEDVKIDLALLRRDDKIEGSAVTSEEISTILNDHKLSVFNLTTTHSPLVLERSILVTTLFSFLQRRDLFLSSQISHLTGILNSHKSGQDSIKFDVSRPSTFAEAIIRSGDIQFSAEQVRTFVSSLDAIFVVSKALASYLVSESMIPLMISSFGLYIEAADLEAKLLETLKLWKSGNRIVSENLTKLQNFILGYTCATQGFAWVDKRQTSVDAADLQFNLIIQNYCLILDQFKTSLKEFLVIESAPSTSSLFSATGFSNNWLSELKHPLVSLGILFTDTESQDSMKVLINKVATRSLPAAEQKRLDDLIQVFSFSHPNPEKDLVSLMKLHDDNVYAFRDYLEKLISLSACLIKKREIQDLSHPDNKKKRKSFRLSNGAEELIEKVLSNAATVPDEDLSKLQWNQLPVDLSQLKDVTETFFMSKNNERRRPKVPKGVCDTDPSQANVKNMAFDIIKGIYRAHGAVEIDTPVFELKETLLGKYGEEGNKLIYDLADQGGELLSLRYDLTVPFARYLATHNIKKFKRFHIGKVYRRDQPDVNKGRFREFYQCDLDIAGEYDVMVPDAEALTIMHEVMAKVDVGDFEIRLSHRGLLEGIVSLSGAPEKKFKTICSAIDKLDKEPWSAVAEELLEKGLEPKTVEKIGKFVFHKGKIDDVLEKVRSEQLFNGHKRSQESLADLELLSKYLKLLKSYDSIVLDLSLARGLDYYTGLIFEIGVLGANVGSVGGGGRYDDLVGMFGTTKIPCVGFSIGIERIFVLLEKKLKATNQDGRQNNTEFLVASIDDGLMEEKMELIGSLWERGFKCEMLYEVSPKPKKQLAFALNYKIPFVLWISQEGVKQSVVKIKVAIRLTSAPILRKNGSSREKIWCKNSRS